MWLRVIANNWQFLCTYIFFDATMIHLKNYGVVKVKAPKQRNFVAKALKSCGAGSGYHKDKKYLAKRDLTKHKSQQQQYN